MLGEVEVQKARGEHTHAHTQDLSRAEPTVHRLATGQKVGERVHVTASRHRSTIVGALQPPYWNATVLVFPSATMASRLSSPSSSCHTFNVYVPGGTFAIVKVPRSSVTAK